MRPKTAIAKIGPFRCMGAGVNQLGALVKLRSLSTSMYSEHCYVSVYTRQDEERGNRLHPFSK